MAEINLGNAETMQTSVYDINYIPDYVKAQQERRANELIRQENELQRIALAEDLENKRDTDYWKGEKGDTGATPDISATASISGGVGTPGVTVTRSGTDEEPILAFAFSNLKGEKGDTGEPEPFVEIKSFSPSELDTVTPITDAETIATLQELYDTADFENLKLTKKVKFYNPFVRTGTGMKTYWLPSLIIVSEDSTTKSIRLYFPNTDSGVVFSEDLYIVSYTKSTQTFQYTVTSNTGYQEASWNKVTSISSQSTDTEYPSAKCVYDLVGNINDVLDAINNEVI